MKQWQYSSCWLHVEQLWSTCQVFFGMFASTLMLLQLLIDESTEQDWDSVEREETQVKNLRKTWNTVCYSINKCSLLRLMASTQKQDSWLGSHVFGSGKLFYKLIWRRSVKLFLNSLNCNFFSRFFCFIHLFCIFYILHYIITIYWCGSHAKIHLGSNVD